MHGKRLLAVLVLVPLLILAAAAWFFRGQLTEIYYARKTSAELAAAGVKEIEAIGLKGFERNTCTTQEECRCVFLIHGMGDSALTWRRILTASDRLPKEVRLIALDLPGMGRSPLPLRQEELQVSRLAARFNQYLASEDCSNTTVVGNSFGGWIALWMGIDYNRPEWGTSAYFIDQIVSLAGTGLKAIQGDEEFFRKLRESPAVEGLKEFQRRAYFKPREYPDSFWEEAVRRAKESRSTELSEAQKDDQYLDGRGYVLPVPIRYYWGEADRIVPREMGEGLTRLFRGSTFQTFSECGHLPQKECPDQVMNAVFYEP